MKKILILFIFLVSFISYSQTKTKCKCCNKPIHRVVHNKNKQAKKKTYVVKPTIPTRTEINVIINNTFNYPPKTETKIDCKDTVIKFIEIPKPILRDKGPEFELYAGFVRPRHINTLGYMIGLNITPNLHQINKNGSEREWLNRFLFGFEFSAYKSKPHTVIVKGSTTDPIINDENCNCIGTTFGGFETGSKYSYYQDVMGVSLNFGVEIYRGWYLTTGVTGYRNKLILDGNTVNTTNSMYIDAGVKKFFKVGNIFLSPMIKFNEQTSSLGLGFSYD